MVVLRPYAKPDAGGGGVLEGRSKGDWKGFQRPKGARKVQEGVPVFEGSAGKVR